MSYIWPGPPKKELGYTRLRGWGVKGKQRAVAALGALAAFGAGSASAGDFATRNPLSEIYNDPIYIRPVGRCLEHMACGLCGLYSSLSQPHRY